MKFYSYLNEDDDISSSHIKELLEKDCKPILKLINDKRIYFVRETDRFSSHSTIQKVQVRTDRKPTDTPLELHKIIDNEFKRLFGWKVRSEGVFCWSRKLSRIDTSTDSPSDRACVFPIGNFKIVFAYVDFFEGRDLFNYMARLYDRMSSTQYNFKRNYTDESPKFKRKFENEVIKAIGENYTSRISELTGGILTGEVSIKCKEYYLVHKNIVKELFG
jgi:hypothetical protein